MNLYEFVPQSAKMLKNLDKWIERALEHAKAKSFDVDTLVHARLAPDQYDFARQVQSACDSAKFSAAYLAAKEAPAHPDTEKTMAELRARIHSCLGFLETIAQTDFVGAEERRVAPRWMQGKWMRGDQYMMQLGAPNFYFHVTVAYEILRHNGVNVGKMDFIGGMPTHDPA